MADKDPSKWRRLQKMSFNSKDLSKRMKKVEGATVKHARRFVVKRWSSFREVRRRISLWALVVGVVIGAAGLQFLWYQNDYTTKTQAEQGTYAEAVQGPVDTLNPIFAKSSAEEAVSELLFSRLLKYDQTGSLQYDLVDSMKVSDDRKTYTFTIRPDARWHDGLYVRARDVVFTVSLLKDPATRSTLQGWGDIKVAAVDDRTVSFELPAAFAAFPHALRFLPILPEHKLRDVEPINLRESSFSREPVGSGPFSLRLLQDIDPTSGRKVVHMAHNESYYAGDPKIDRIQLHVYKDQDAIKRALVTSEVNAASDLSVIAAADVNTERYIIENRPVNSGVYALLNTKSPVLSDAKVRRALQLGTDTAKIRQSISDKLPALHLPFVNGQLKGDSVPAAPTPNVAEAAKLLEEAGWVLKDGTRVDKDGRSLALSVVTTKNPDYEKALEGIASQWRALGVSVTTQIIDPSDASQNVAQEILQPRRYDVLLHQLSIGSDPDVYGYWHSTQASAGSNFSNYSNPISDEALESARVRDDAQLRNAKYLAFSRQWLQDVPAIGIYQATAQYVHTRSIYAIPADYTLISPIDRYGSVRYWAVGERSVFATP